MRTAGRNQIDLCRLFANKVNKLRICILRYSKTNGNLGNMHRNDFDFYIFYSKII